MSTENIVNIAQRARIAANKLQYVTTQDKSIALNKIKNVLADKKQEIFKANRTDKEV
jgi:glutamate-5-semialdehyde dehydrogenase